MAPKMMDGKVKITIKQENGDNVVFEGFVTEVSITDDMDSMNKHFELKGVMTSSAMIEHEIEPPKHSPGTYSTASSVPTEFSRQDYDVIRKMLEEGGHPYSKSPLGSLSPFESTPEIEMPLYRNMPEPKPYIEEIKPGKLEISGLEKMKKAFEELTAKVMLVPKALEPLAEAMTDPTKWAIKDDDDSDIFYSAGEATLEEALSEIQDEPHPEDEQSTQHDVYMSLVNEFNKQIPIGFVKEIKDGIADVDITPGAIASRLPAWEYPRLQYRYEATLKSGKRISGYSTSTSGDDSEPKKNNSWPEGK